MKDLVISKETTERAVVVGLITPRQPEGKVNEYLDELEFLADTAGGEVVKRFTQKVDTPQLRDFRRQRQAGGNKGICREERHRNGDFRR